MRPCILWFRLDLRLSDNPALRAALDRDAPIIPLFIWSPEEEKPWEPGAASRWWLHQSIKSLNQNLKKLGAPLIIRKGDSLENLKSIIKETKADAIFWNQRYEPVTFKRDNRIKKDLLNRGLEVQTFNGNLLYEPWELKTKAGKPFQVFTPYWKMIQNLPEHPLPFSKPKKIPSLKKKPFSERLEDLELEPKIDWASGIRKNWNPGERGAQREISRFLRKGVLTYEEDRDRPDITGTSRLSPHLHFGEISPWKIWHTVQNWKERSSNPKSKIEAASFLRQLVWREFAHHLLYHFPETSRKPLREKFQSFPWRKNKKDLVAWQKGETGYPIVDAGMRELWTTGWMHNRVRMIVASFLTKDLLISWCEGAKWFWDTLIDADLANNTLGWQWVAGCGADAAPFFRIFNPISQGEKFDPQAVYIRKWVPEIAKLPNEWIYQPWETPKEILKKAGIQLGKNYPKPIVDHLDARQRALEAFQKIRGGD